MSEDYPYPTIHLRFSKSRLPLVKMRVRVMADAVQIEYTLRSNSSSIYVQKQMQYFDYEEEPFLKDLWDGQAWDWELLDRLSRRYEVEEE
jgi:hypothetical protein